MRVITAVLVAAAIGVATPLTKAMADYKILSDDRFQTRRVVAVELLERKKAPNLTKIADAIKARDTKPYQRTVVNFYLPSMSLGDGSWATVSYSPFRLTTINGLSREEELALFQKTRNDKRDRIGSWIASSAPIAGEVVIFRRDGRKFVEWSLKSGLKKTDEVSETRTWRGRRFDIKSGSNTYFLINNSNDLEIRDVKGLIATGEAIVPNARKRRLSALAHSRSRLGAPLPPEAVTRQTTTRPVATRPIPAGSAPTRPLTGRHHANTVRALQPRTIARAPLPSSLPPVQPTNVVRPKVAKPQAPVAPRVKKTRSRRTTASDVFMSNIMR